MTRKNKNIFLIITIYFLSFILFELFIGAARALENAKISEELGMLSIFTPFETLIEAGICHFIFVSVIALMCKFIKKIDKAYKHIIYFFPLITFIFAIPIGLMVTYTSNYLNWFGL